MNRLLILDGNALLHRAFHALPPLTSPDGQPVGAVYGFLSMVIRLRQDLSATHMAVCFDRPKPTFRNELYKEYQAQRPPMDLTLVSQIGLTHDALQAFNIAVFENDGFEADDVIGTIAHAFTASQTLASSGVDQIIIVTGDRDILQLVKDGKVFVYMPVKGLSEAKLYGKREVIERLGVTPEQIPDWKALCGDPSDNYPGVAGIGPKTAANLIHTYTTIEQLYEAIEKGAHALSPSVLNKLIKGKELAYMSKQLAVIRTDAPVTIDVESLVLGSFQSESVKEVLQRFGFPSLLKRLQLQSKAMEKVTVKNIKKEKKTNEQMSLL